MNNSEINSLIKSLNGISNQMGSFQDDVSNLYKFVNTLSKKKIEFLYNYYEHKNFKNIKLYKRYQGVRDTRKYLLETLLKNNRINDSVMQVVKNKVINNAKNLGHKREIFHSWKNWSILFPFFYNLYKEVVFVNVKLMVLKVISDLSLEGYVDYHIVDFNGATNFGNRRIWFAIYNKSHKTQRTAYQIFFYIKENEIRYGLYKHSEVSNQINSINVKNFSYSKMIEDFRGLRRIIINDIAKGTKTKRVRGRKGTKSKNLMSYFKKGTKGGIVDRVHNNMQQAYCDSLIELYKNNKEIRIEMEENHIDITVEKQDSIDLYEIKTSQSPIYCIREALGQLLFYLSRVKQKSKKITLIVMGRNELNEDSKEFEEFLKNNLNVEFQYQAFNT